MRFAKEQYSGKIVDAFEARRGALYVCPSCGAEVFMRDGIERETHFAHYPGKGSPDCEQYHPGLFGSGNEESDPLIEDKPESFGLIVALFDEAWDLCLRLPEIPTEELGSSSLSELGRARVNVFCGESKIGSVPALDFRPGVGVARVKVQPALTEYKCQTAGRWPEGISRIRWEKTTAGISAKGTLFRLRAGEWTKLRDRSFVAWGESLLLLADNRCLPPEQVNAHAKHATLFKGLQWRCWLISLPESPHAEVTEWLELLSYRPKPPNWQIRFLSIPVAYTDAGPQFETGSPLVVEFVAPIGSDRAKISVQLGVDIFESIVSTSAGYTFHIDINSDKPTIGLIQAIDRDHGSAKESFGFVSPKQSHNAVNTPRLRVRIGSIEWEPWCASNTPKADPDGEVVFNIGVEGVRLEVLAWLHIGRHPPLQHAAPSDVSKLLTDLLPQAEIFEIDAGNLGWLRIHIQGRTPSMHEIAEPSRLDGWVGAMRSAVSMGVGLKPVAFVPGKGETGHTVGPMPLLLSTLSRVRKRKLR